VRSFFAVYPDESARRALAEVAPDDADDVRVTDMAEWHVTLRFLGDLDDDDLAAVRVAARAATIGAEPFEVRLGPLTALGAAARVLFVPAEGADLMAEQLDAALGDLGEPREGPFRGHLTLARARGRGRLPVALVGTSVHTTFVVAEVVLIGSRLEPDRAVHHVVDRFAFGGGST
jgi:2'-5' RNA ligase